MQFAAEDLDLQFLVAILVTLRVTPVQLSFNFR